MKLKSILHFLDLSAIKCKPFHKRSETLHLFKDSRKRPVFLSTEQITGMVSTLDFLFREQHITGDFNAQVLDSTLSVNLLPTFKHRFTRFYGPADKLFNITFKEFIVAETLFRNYSQSQDDSFLSKLIATLYRPKTKNADTLSFEFNGDVREPFNDHIIEARGKRMDSLNPSYRFAIALYYQGCRKFLHTQFSNVFSGSSSSGSSNHRGYLDLVNSLTNNDVTKTEEVRNSMLFDVLVHLENVLKEQKQAKSKQNKSK